MRFRKFFSRPKRLHKRRIVKRKGRSSLYVTAKKAAKSAIAATKQVKHTQYEGAQVGTVGSTSCSSFVYWPAQGTAAYGDIETEGSTQGQRIGNTIFIKSIVSNYQLTIGNGVTTDVENICRLTVFQWMDDIALHFPTYGDIFTQAGGSYPYLSPYNYDSRHKYKILYDKTWTLSENAGNPYVVRGQIRLKKLKLKKIVFDKDATSGYDAAIYKGGIFWIFTSDSAIAPSPTIVWSQRMTYTD